MIKDKRNRKIQMANDATIKALKPDVKMIEYTEKDRTRGTGTFGIRVSSGGTKSWFFMYKFKGSKQQKFNFGTYPEISLLKAKNMATDKIKEIKNDHDPEVIKKREAKEEEKKAEENRKYITDLWQAYEDSLDLKKKKKAPATLKEELRRWNKEIKPHFGKMRVDEVTPAIIADFLDDLARKSPVSANRLYSLMRIMFKPALRKGWIEAHPMQWLERPAGEEVSRKRVLSDDEIVGLWPYFVGVAGDILKLVLLSCQRSGEVMSMRWGDLNFDNNVWTQENTKNGSYHLTPISTQMLEVIEKQRGNDEQWVFPSPHKKLTHIANIHKARYRFHKVSSIDGWTAHDLRRTGRTIMSRLDIDRHTRERVLNHSQEGIVAVYDQHDYLKEKRKALKLLGEEIYRILSVAPDEQVKIDSLREAQG